MQRCTQETTFELEQLMGDGSWSKVYQTKEEAEYGCPVPVSFELPQEAIAYAKRYVSKSSKNYRVVKVDTSILRTILSPE